MSIKRRIYYGMLLLALITIIFTSFLIIRITYREFYIHMQQQIRNEALFISAGFHQSGGDFFARLEEEANISRITWVAGNGKVLYDNRANPETMENHRNRPEIADALKYGCGESVHLSNTLGTQTFYYAVLLEDGTVLRVSAITSSVYRSVLRLIPYVAILSLPVIILAMVIANMLTKKIVSPINNLNLETPLFNETYDELSPLLSRMDAQNAQIENQIKKLKDTRAEFNAITENIREGIIVLDDKGQILSINKSAAAIFSINEKHLINKHIFILYRGITFQKAVESAMNGQTCEDIFTRDKKTYHILVSPVRDSHIVKGVILFIWDITEKEYIERMRREFSANVSHELKTPLTSISGYAELIKNGVAKPEDIANFSERIYNESKHLIRLVDDIIQVSKLDEKNVQLPFEDINLLELAQEAAGRLSPLASKKGIRLAVSGETAYISGVRQLIEEMIYNLCDNAIKYNYQNGRVDINVRRTPDHVILTIADNGFGIPREHQKRVFERFYRIDKSHSRQTGGTGLGLSIVKHSAEYHNAKIQLSSEPGKGTTIAITFNIEKY
jgi:two-component system phosphate regulon sensor histidine kinase PhoR